jgi:tetratricopeptide (TPR) repeat protein
VNPVKRNDPCPCGSGLKYKKCCMVQPAVPTAAQPDHAEKLSLAYKHMGDEQWKEALEKFESILTLVSSPEKILHAMGACCDGLEDYDNAVQYYEKALAASPPSKRVFLYYAQGVSLACAQRIDEAAEAFARCLEHADDPGMQASLEKILAGIEDIRNGRKKSSMYYIQAQLQRAFSDMENDRYQQAYDRFLKLLELDPENAAVSYNLGVALTFLKREEEALAHFERTVAIAPDFVQAWYNMGQIRLIKLKDFSRALNCFDRAINFKDDYVSAHHQRGVAFELLGDRKSAIACWERTLELDPLNTQAQDNIRRVRAASDFVERTS